MSNINNGGNVFGILSDVESVATTTTNINAAANRMAIQFSPLVNCGLNSVRIRQVGVTGAPAANDISCSLHPISASGNPDLTIILSEYTCSTVPAANTWLNFTGSTYQLTGNLWYSLVFRNVDAAPATNAFSVLRSGDSSGKSFIYSDNGGTFGYMTKSSTNSGGTWTSLNASLPFYRLGFSDGTYYGFPCSAANTVTPAATGSFGSGQEVGVSFITPRRGMYRLAGVGASLSKSGTPQSSVVCKLYRNTTLITTSSTVITSSWVLTTQQTYGFHFNPPVKLDPNVKYRATFAESSGSGAVNTNRWNLYYYTFDSDSNSLPLKPMNGSMMLTYLTQSTWTDHIPLVPIVAFFSDDDNPLYVKSQGFGSSY
jgi:hypothetical protein